MSIKAKLGLGAGTVVAASTLPFVLDKMTDDEAKQRILSIKELVDAGEFEQAYKYLDLVHDENTRNALRSYMFEKYEQKFPEEAKLTK